MLGKGQKDKLNGNVIKPRVSVGKEKEMLTNLSKEILSEHVGKHTNLKIFVQLLSRGFVCLFLLGKRILRFFPGHFSTRWGLMSSTYQKRYSRDQGPSVVINGASVATYQHLPQTLPLAEMETSGPERTDEKNEE